MISETKLDKSFPPGQFLPDDYRVILRSDVVRNGGGIYQRGHTIETFTN